MILLTKFSKQVECVGSLMPLGPLISRIMLLGGQCELD
jgi:hypothetical protein